MITTKYCLELCLSALFFTKTAFDCVGLVTLGVEHLFWTEFKQATSDAAKTPEANTAGYVAVNYDGPMICDSNNECSTK